MNMRNLVLFLVAGVLALPASGRAQAPLLERVLITEAAGTLEVARDGSVAAVTVEKAIEEPLRSSLAAGIRKLRFEPIRIKGEAVHALTGFHVVLVGREQGSDLAVSMDSINFGTPKGMKAELTDDEPMDITPVRMTPPSFPRQQERAARMGRVQLALRIGADGRVQDATVIDSVLLDTGVKAGVVDRALRDFEEASLQAARRWTFSVPPQAAGLSPREMTRTTSVDYVFSLKRGADLHKHGQWLAAYRGPKRAVGWLPAEESRDMTETAVAGGSIGGGKSRFRLLTPVGQQPLL